MLKAPMKVLILGGFLGAGKTSAMNRLLGPVSSLGSVALLINEFGEIPVDTAIIDRGEYALREISGGCVCCSLKGKLNTAVSEIRSDLAPDYLLLEATGLAEPGEIFSTVTANEGCLAAGLLCVDPAQYLKFSGALSIFDRQVVGAETILLTKSDLRSTDEKEAVRRRIRAASPTAFVCEDPLEALAALTYRSRAGRFATAPADDTGRIIQRTLRFPGGFKREKLERFCRSAHEQYGDQLFRLKGVALMDGVYTAIHYTDRGLTAEAIPIQESDKNQSSFLLFIGTQEALLGRPPEEFFS